MLAGGPRPGDPDLAGRPGPGLPPVPGVPGHGGPHGTGPRGHPGRQAAGDGGPGPAGRAGGDSLPGGALGGLHHPRPGQPHGLRARSARSRGHPPPRHAPVPPPLRRPRPTGLHPLRLRRHGSRRLGRPRRPRALPPPPLRMHGGGPEQAGGYDAAAERGDGGGEVARGEGPLVTFRRHARWQSACTARTERAKGVGDDRHFTAGDPQTPAGHRPAHRQGPGDGRHLRAPVPEADQRPAVRGLLRGGRGAGAARHADLRVRAHGDPGPAPDAGLRPRGHPRGQPVRHGRLRAGHRHGPSGTGAHSQGRDEA
ncbi:putative Phosphatidylinositol alpha-mannosyltransferase [Streptomyces misionensis JCM 4497]